ncbi:MAG: RNA polymerase sigma factor [Steroidobacteraceae bacterium]|nr:RNA polymerase sigma factor [Steroidobacteraceae bacterium]
MSVRTAEEAVAARDPAGVDAEQCRKDLHRYLVRRLHNNEIANDLAQEAFLRYLQLPDAGVVRKPDAYLFRIAVNLIYEWRMRKDRAIVTYSSDLVERFAATLACSGTDDYERLTSREHLQKVLDSMPARPRQVLWMNKVEGKNYDVIAKELGLKPRTVLNALARAIAHARRVQYD